MRATGKLRCQCPLGLIHHFYLMIAVITTAKRQNRVNALSGLYIISTNRLTKKKREYWSSCQCPLGLIHHFYISLVISLATAAFFRVNALSGLYIISTVALQKPRFYAVSRACFCRYLSECSDNSRFSCMLTFWTYLMRCTYP